MDDTQDAAVAPQSPNLNAYTDVEPLPSQHQRYRGSISHTLTPFTPTDAKSPWSRTPGWGQQQQQQQLGYFPPQPQPQQQSYRPQQNFEASPQAFTQNPFALPASGAGEERPWDQMAPSSRGNAGVKAEPGIDGLAANGANGGPRLDIEVKTKFPVARIKRIMQSDEDVGKVAQVTPVVVSKALELFMIDLVTTSAAEAKSRSSKRVTAAHLKTAVMSSAKYSDWLGDIVSKAPDAPAASAKAAKDEVDSDEEFFGSGATGSAAKKKRRAPSRRGKGGDDD